ncbi:T9SS type A sorting domain-containing protein [Flavobacterium sp.]|uniref:T9SS type A sorting domain-containing protein n=1 Tax=Flavobacterium sp. TaxID=239 RepID=UPI00286BFAA5|nr:T9SS type A sorting domain-containing protein [Flavobacterium sp.]
MRHSFHIASLFLALFLVFENSYSQHDLCENAIVLTPAIDISWYGNSTTGNFIGSTIGSPAPTCAPNASQDVWYKFVATATLMTVSLQSYNQNYGVQVFENSCSGTIMGCVNLQANQTDDFASNHFIVGSTYYIRVFNSTVSSPSDYEFEISVLQPPSPENDLCQNALIEEPCNGSCAPFYGTFHGATISNPSVGCAPNASQDVWVKFKAGSISNVITAYPNSYSGLDVALEIYEGSCTGPLIACVNNTLGGYPEQYRETNFVIDQTYYIRVLNASNAVSTGTFVLSVWNDYFPLNDLATNAELIAPSPSTCKTGTFYHASISSPPASCIPNTYLDVWYKFVPTTPGMTIFLDPVAAVNFGMQILEGSATGTTIACVNANPISSGETFTYMNYTVGQTYFIRVLNLGGDQNASFQICITNNLPPVNDLCSNASVLTPSADLNTTTQGFFNFSTINAPAPSCGANSSQDVWYQFNATTTTMSVILSQAGFIDIGLQVFQGSCNGLILGCVHSDHNVFQSYNYGEITLNNFIVGQTYFVRVFNASATLLPSTFNITVKEYAAQPNDFCANAITITPNLNYCGDQASGEMNGATISSSVPNCANTIMTDVWYQFVATTSMAKINLSSYVTGFDLGYEVFQNSCSGTSIFCGNTAADPILPTLTVGQTYYIRAFNLNTTLTSYSNFSICVIGYPSPANDLCSNATMINADTICNTVMGLWTGATISGSSASCAPNANQDLWYKFVAVAPGMKVSLYQYGWDYGIDQSLEIYGTCTGQPLACANTSTSSPSEEIAYSNFTVGQTYYIRALCNNINFAGYNFQICVTYTPPPANDLCQNATVLTPSSTWSAQYGMLYNSSISSATPSCAENTSQDVWYSFVATNTLLKINLDIYSAGDYGLQVFQGSCSGNIVGCILNNPQITFDGFAYNNYVVGQTYYIRVFNPSSTANDLGFNIYIIDYPAPDNDLCENATLLIPGNACATTIGTFTGANSNGVSNCNSGATQDVWYQFVATNPTMSITIPANNEIDLGMEIKTGSCTGTSLGCVNANPMNFTERFTQNNFIVGQTYFIRVFHLNTTTPMAPFEIFVQEFAAPINDASQSATSLTPSASCNAITGTFNNSSICNLSFYCTVGASQDVWYEFTATTPLTQILASPENELDLGLEIYSSNSINLYPITCNNAQAAGLNEQVMMSDFIVGQKYWIRILNVNNNTSMPNFEICVQEFQIPTNDWCENATLLTANAIVNEPNGALNSATLTGSIPTCTSNNYAYNDVWYKFVATNNTMTVALPWIENLYAGLAIYQNGCSNIEMGCMSAQNIQAQGAITLNNYTVGDIYFIRVFGESGYPITPAFRVFVTSPTLGLPEYSLDKIALFPNPTHDLLNLKLPDNQNFKIIHYSITNMLGQNVFRTAANYQKVDVSAFSKGVYQVLLETDKGNWTGKFIKE